jgi:hypothetical protein
MTKRRRHLNGFGMSGPDRFIKLPHYMLKSPAWKYLPPEAKAVLLDIWQRHNGVNNGTISYAVREAGAIFLARNTASAALERCVDMGFLVATVDSGFNVKGRTAREWRITAERHNGQPATKEFMRWQPSPDMLPATGSKKFKRQSLYRADKSLHRDASRQNRPKNPPQVTVQGLKSAKTAPHKSLYSDASNIPSVGQPKDALLPSLLLWLFATTPAMNLALFAPAQRLK